MRPVKNNKKREIIDKYNQTSEFYDRRYEKIQEDKYFLILNDITINEKVILDTGCGTGLLFDYMESSFKNSNNQDYHYVGVDISINMLKRFRFKIDQKAKRIDLILSDLENLPLRENTIDLLFSFTSLQNLPDIIQGIRESFRVVKNGADVHFSILKKRLNKEKLISIIKPKLMHMKIIERESIEDTLFTGIALKK
jgi:ubiquinone/menaquinone biosynthesis C-methylase UbiE